jgi:hypothetical protein
MEMLSKLANIKKILGLEIYPEKFINRLENQNVA